MEAIKAFLNLVKVAHPQSHKNLTLFPTCRAIRKVRNNATENQRFTFPSSYDILLAIRHL